MTSEFEARESAAGSAGGRWHGDVAVGVRAWAGRSASESEAELPADEVATGPEADHEAVARKILLDQLTGQARSRAELRKKLDAKNVPAELAEGLLDRFTEVGLIDDAAFASAWIESRHTGRGLAPRALAQELRRKGVAEDVIAEALTAVDQDSQEDAARVLVRKKLRSVQEVDSVTATRRLVGMLARKGYGQGLAFRVVRDELKHDLPQE